MPKLEDYQLVLKHAGTHQQHRGSSVDPEKHRSGFRCCGQGIMLTGGGAPDGMIVGTAGSRHAECIADNPDALYGAGKALEEIETLKRVAISTKNIR